MIQMGNVRFPRKGCEKLIQQLTGFGVERHDDLMDAIIMVVAEVVQNPTPQPNTEEIRKSISLKMDLSHVNDGRPSYLPRLKTSQERRCEERKERFRYSGMQSRNSFDDGKGGTIAGNLWDREF